MNVSLPTLDTSTLLTAIIVIVGLTALLIWGRGAYMRMRTTNPRAANHAAGIVVGILVFAGIAKIGMPPVMALIGGAVIYGLFTLQNGPSRPKNTRHVPPPAERPGNMTDREARLILGVESNATREDIQAAFRAAMRRNHPDQGGSGYLAGKIVQARDMLIRTAAHRD